MLWNVHICMDSSIGSGLLGRSNSSLTKSTLQHYIPLLSFTAMHTIIIKIKKCQLFDVTLSTSPDYKFWSGRARHAIRTKMKPRPKLLSFKHSREDSCCALGAMPRRRPRAAHRRRFLTAAAASVHIHRHLLLLLLLNAMSAAGADDAGTPAILDTVCEPTQTADPEAFEFRRELRHHHGDDLPGREALGLRRRRLRRGQRHGVRPRAVHELPLPHRLPALLRAEPREAAALPPRRRRRHLPRRLLPPLRRGQLHGRRHWRQRHRGVLQRHRAGGRVRGCRRRAGGERHGGRAGRQGILLRGVVRARRAAGVRRGAVLEVAERQRVRRVRGLASARDQLVRKCLPAAPEGYGLNAGCVVRYSTRPFYLPANNVAAAACSRSSGDYIFYLIPPFEFPRFTSYRRTSSVRLCGLFLLVQKVWRERSEKRAVSETLNFSDSNSNSYYSPSLVKRGLWASIMQIQKIHPKAYLDGPDKQYALHAALYYCLPSKEILTGALLSFLHGSTAHCCHRVAVWVLSALAVVMGIAFIWTRMRSRSRHDLHDGMQCNAHLKPLRWQVFDAVRVK